jgi:hypothetical protein
MARRAEWYMQAEVERLIENWARWPGFHGGHSSRSTLSWLDDFIAMKRVGDRSAPIPVMGGEAGDTQDALGRMNADLRNALVVYYTGRGPMRERLSALNAMRSSKDRIKLPAFFNRVERAHQDFMRAIRAVRADAAAASAANRRSFESGLTRRRSTALLTKLPKPSEE